MAVEKLLKAISPRLFTADGTERGQVTLASTKPFKVKQIVSIQSNTRSPAQYQVKRVDSDTVLYVGPIGGKISDRSDLSSFLVAESATISASEQNRPTIPEQEIERLTYEEEPTVARRTILVGPLGEKIDSITDSHGVNRLAVDGMFTAEVDVQVDVDIDGYYDAANNPDPDNIGIIGHTRSSSTDETKQKERITAKRGTVDTDTVSMDASLHDQSGNAYTSVNPVPVSSTYDKFFNLIAASKWMKEANYNSVVPTFSGNDLTLRYQEDDAILGDAIITNYVSLNSWQLTLLRYLDDDDGSILQDDDGSALNLD